MVQPKRKPTEFVAAEGAVDARAEPALIAHPVHGWATMPIVPAPPARAWMQATHDRFAERCLPLLIANQSGWLILNSHSFRACWEGGDATSSLTIIYLDGKAPYPATSMFGYGIITFYVPYLFRTPPAYNLLARGPANLPKDGAAALEGVVETDWTVATFTMNWKLTRPGQVVTFEHGEPICMIVPQRRGELEAFRPRVESIERDPELFEHHLQWAESRARFLSELRLRRRVEGRFSWQRHYFQGSSPSGAQASQHQTRLRLRPFAEPTEDRT